MDELIKRLGIVARAEMSNYAERTVLEAATSLAAAQVEIGRLREALRFYANEDDWDDLKSDEAAAAFDRNTGSKLGYDNGETARAALSTKGAADAQDGMGEG